MFKDNSYLIERLGMSARVCGLSRMKGMIGKGSLRLAKGLLTAGLVASLCGLLSNNPESPHSAIPFAHLFSVPPVEASGTQPVDLSESAPIPLLNAWPEILDDTPAEPLIPPSLARKRTKERPLLSIDRNHQAEPVSTILVPEVNSSAKIALTSLFTEAAPQPVSTSELLPMADRQVDSTYHDPEEETPVDGEISAEEDEEVLFDEETPVYTEEELQQVQSEHSEPAPAPAKKSGRKGYTIRVEGDDLVVFDAEGNEVYRKGKGESKSKARLSKASGESGSTLGAEIKKPGPASKAPLQPSTQPAGGDQVFHEVAKGENPSIIARKYAGLTAQKLMEANGITDPSSLQIGTKLWIPTTVQGATHVVQEGETLSDLLKTYEVDNLFEVCDVNGLSRDTNTVAAGTILVIPGAKVKAQAPVKKRPTAITIDSSTFKGRAGWAWPVEVAQVSSPYGLRIDPFSLLKKKSGVAAGGGKDGVKRSFHHGIDLSMPVGTPVKAARDGEIIKVSQSRWGHGRMVQILHEDGWSTVYSHNSKILVKVGDQVKQGDVIALSGNTGRSTGPHLHFEVRRPDQRSVDPKRFLSALE